MNTDNRRRIKDNIILSFFGIQLLMLLIILSYMVGILIIGGIHVISWKTVFTSMLKGGLFETIIGTFLLFSGTAILAAPIGLGAAIYLSEYASKNNKIVRLIDQAINNLAGVPSIVTGLFGYTFFVKILGFGISLMSGWLTLTIMALPIIVRGSEEAIRMVPKEFRETAMALGATKWQAIKDNVLPTATPGIATSIILGIARIAGETAAILFTACALTMRGLPRTPFDPIISLTYYLFVILVTSPSTSQNKAYAAAIILLSLVFLLNLVAIVLRAHYRRKWRR